VSDLRTFLEEVRKTRPRDLLVIDREVSPKHETATIVAKLEDRQRTPIVYFSRVAGTKFPVVSSVAGSQGRIALALGVPLKDLSRKWAEGCEHPIAPQLVEDAPAYENLSTGPAVDLSILPALVYHEHDGPAPYLTAAIVAARDPESGKINLSFHRMMIAGRNRTGIFIEKKKHLDRIHQRYRAKRAPMPIAVFIGWHPAWAIGALYSGSADVEEYDVIGGLLGRGLPVAGTRTQPDLYVPAFSELVLEGTVDHEETIEEGPFGEFTGYGTGKTQTPVFTVTALAHRNDMIFQDVVSGQMEHLVLPMLAIEHRIREDARRASSNVTRVVLAAPLTAIVALDKKSDDEPRRIIDAILAGDIYSKQVIVVDDDVDPHDFRQVLSAMALTVQADRDVLVFADAQGTPLDPSCPSADGKSAKLGIDATRSLTSGRSVTRNSFPQAIWDAIDLKVLMK
jgi:2,5-furandicarboxylate decarboxylase 1